MRNSPARSVRPAGRVIHQIISPTRIVCLFLTLQFAGYDRLAAQRYLTTFGAVLELPTARNAHGLLSGDFNGDGLSDLASYGGTSLMLHYQPVPPREWQSVTLKVDHPIRFAAAARCNDDKLDDIVIATEHPGEIQVYLGRPRKGMFFSWRKVNAEPFNHLVVANINNDRKADILVCGEKQLGVQVFLGNGNGTFRSSETLFGEYSFSALAVDDMNDDGIADVLAGNWISEALFIYSGFGRMKYADPVILPLAYEPTFVTTAYFDPDAVKDIIVVSATDQSCQVLSGDGLGGFRASAPVLLGAPPSGISLADVNGDGTHDVGMLSSEGRFLAVGLNDGKGVLKEVIKFAGGRAPSSFAFYSHGKTHLTNAAILDSAMRRIRVALNAGIGDPSGARSEYLTGLSPTGIASARLRKNRADDLFVGNSASAAVSYFQNQANGGYGGQMSFASLTKPTDVTFVWGNDSTAVLLLSDPLDRSCSIMEIRTNDFSHRSYALPLGRQSELLSVDADARSGDLSILALEYEERRGRASIIEFEQIAPSRFIERTCTPFLPSPTDACVATRRTLRGPRDICYVRYNAKTKSEEVYQMFREKPRQFSSPVLAFSVPAPENAGVFAWSGDLNADGTDDLILNVREPANLLLVSLGTKDSSFAPPIARAKQVAVRSLKDLQLADANGDGVTDIVFENSITRSMYYWPGAGDGSFLPRVRLMSTEGVGSFTLGRRRVEGAPDLMLTDQVRGVVRIISFTGGEE